MVVGRLLETSNSTPRLDHAQIGKRKLKKEWALLARVREMEEVRKSMHTVVGHAMHACLHGISPFFPRLHRPVLSSYASHY